MLFVCTCNVYPILFSYSRAAYMCSLAAMLTLGLFKDRRLLLLLIVLIFCYRIVLPNSVVERIDITFLDKSTVTEEELQSIYDCALASSVPAAHKQVLTLEVTGIGRQPPETGERDLAQLLTHSS